MNNAPNILVIDDEVQIRRLLQLTLESNYHLKFAETGKEGIIKAGLEKLDLIILDLGLPDIDGLSVLKEIRGWATLPIIILTVRNTEDDIISCLNAGADDYLIKPFRTGELLARVKTALRHQPTVLDKDSLVRIILQ